MDPGSISMRHTKLKAEEAALIAGELVKPSWASRNEGIHERVSFEDTLWGFELAGGIYYKTPLRVVYVKPDSRAEHACIKLGDTVLRINGVDTSTLTLQEAHQLILDAGINLKLAVTSPYDDKDKQYVYEDPLAEDAEISAEALAEFERQRLAKILAKTHRHNLRWPWVRRKFIIYGESNCFMVPSKYENKHRDKYPERPSVRIDYFFPEDELKAKVPEPNEHENKTNESNGVEVTEQDAEDLAEDLEEEIEDEEVLEQDTDDENLEQETDGDAEDLAQKDSHEILEVDSNSNQMLDSEKDKNSDTENDNIEQEFNNIVGELSDNETANQLFSPDEQTEDILEDGSTINNDLETSSRSEDLNAIDKNVDNVNDEGNYLEGNTSKLDEENLVKGQDDTVTDSVVSENKDSSNER